MATIGYGTRDIFFGNCWIMIFVLTSQICVKIIADAIIIGVIYCRISRPNKRAATIVFSNNAIIKRINDRLYFTFRVCELRKHQLVEAHIRCYAIRHERDCETGEVIPFKSHSMRLNHPNDELGGMLLMCFPQDILHELDAWSPLMPPPTWGSSAGVYHWHPPVMAHARINNNKSYISSDPVENYYDPNLYTSWPGISRRTASEDPGGLWRKKSSIILNEFDDNSLNNTPQRKAHVKHKKKRISLGITRHIERGKSRQNYFEMIRTLAEAASSSNSPPPPQLPPINNDGSLLSDSLHSNDNYSNLTPSSVTGHDKIKYNMINNNSDDDSDDNANNNNDHEDCEQTFHPFQSLQNNSNNNTPLSPTTPSSPSSPSTSSISPKSPLISSYSTTSYPNPQLYSKQKLPLKSSLSFSQQQKEKDQEQQQSNNLNSTTNNNLNNHTNTFQTHYDKYFNNIQWKNEEINMVNRFIEDRNIEIIVLIEGQDSTTGGVVQARHSYKLDDILWNTSFIPCVLQDELDGTPVIDFCLFHQTELTANTNDPEQNSNNNDTYNTFEKSYQNDGYSSYAQDKV